MKYDELINLQGGYGGTCAYICTSLDGVTQGYCNETQANAKFMAEGCDGQGYWCCDSCESASWYAGLCG